MIGVDDEPILFGGDVGGNKNADGYEIFAFDPVISSLTRLTTSSGNDFEPAASPDGSMIAFSSGRNPAGIYIHECRWHLPTTDHRRRQAVILGTLVLVYLAQDRA